VHRDRSIDYARSLGILLVVAGHSQGPWPLEKAIYSFHMPLFFLLSGYLSTTTPMREMLRSKVRSLIIPYLIACIITFIVFGKELWNSSETWTKLLFGIFSGGFNGTMEFNSPLWFLPTLFTIFILHYFAMNYISSKFYIFLISITASFLLNSYVKNNEINIFRIETAIYSYPFFIAGSILYDYNNKSKINAEIKNIFIQNSILPFLVSFSMWIFFRLIDNNAYYVLGHNKISPILLFYVNGFAGSFIIFSISQIVVAIFNFHTKSHIALMIHTSLAALSGASFGIYLFHKPFIILTSPFFLSLTSSKEMTFVLNMTVGISAPLICLYILYKVMPNVHNLILGSRRKQVQITLPIDRCKAS